MESNKGRSLKWFLPDHPERLRTDQWLALPMTRHRDSFAHLVARQLASAHLDDVPVMAIDSLTAQKRLIEAGILTD